MNCIKKMISFMLLLCSVMVLHAQQAPYGVKGTVVDVQSFAPLAGVTISVANSKLATTTNEKGEFFLALPNDKSAEYLLRATLMGYDGQELTVSLAKNDTEFVSFALKNADAVIEEVVVTRRREKASELAILEERKKSNLMLETIGAQELSRKGVSDAQAALTKMAGVSKQDGAKNVFVRGLGDRYNSTSLNGLPLPSEDPLFKNISLDFFSSDIIQSINVNKTFNAQIAGDVTGANVDIYSKEATGNSFQIGIGSGVNSQTIGKDNFKRIDGTNWIGTVPFGAQPKMTSLTDYNFTNSWNPNAQKNLFNTDFKLLGSRRIMIGSNPLSIFFTASMDSKYRFSEGKIQEPNTAGGLILDQNFIDNGYHVSQTGMLNLKYTWANNNVNFNSLYIHDQKQNLYEFQGMDMGISDFTGDRVHTRRQQVNDNHVFVNQLSSKLAINSKWSADLAAGFNYVLGNEPDRRINRIIERNNGDLVYPRSSSGENERYFGKMNETGIVGKAILNYDLKNGGDLERNISFGYSGNVAERTFKWWEVNHKLLSVSMPSISLDDVESILGANGTGKYYQVETSRGTGSDALLPYYYTGKRRVNSGLASLTYQFTSDLTAVAGFRLDNYFQSVSYETNLTDFASASYNKISKNFFLPSLNLKYTLADNMFLRLAGSKTYTVPQFIELAPVRYRGNNNFTQGNPLLKPSQSYNVDLKWEMYPTLGELISVGVFYKNIQDPIARIEAGGAGTTLSYFNIGKAAMVYGAEVEVKKDLWKSEGSYGENVLSAGANVSYLHSSQELSLEGKKFVKAKDQLEGASPLLVNADVTYKLFTKNVELTPSVVFNYFSDRIYSYGINDYQNIMEKGVPRLDFITQALVNKKIGVNLKIENILNPDRQLSRKIPINNSLIMVEQYKRGIDYTLGISYKF